MVPWLFEIGLVSMATVWPARVGALPAPSNYLASAIVFGPLALLSDTKYGKVATLTAWALVLASLMSVIDPTNPVKPCSSAAPTPKPATAGPQPV